MLGFKFYIYRQSEQRHLPVSTEANKLTRVLSFETGIEGFEWIEILTNRQCISFLDGTGYPFRYTATLKDIGVELEKAITKSKSLKVATEGESSVVPEWMIKQDFQAKNIHVTTLSYSQKLAEIDPEEWLLIEVWDQG